MLRGRGWAGGPGWARGALSSPVTRGPPAARAGPGLAWPERASSPPPRSSKVSRDTLYEAVKEVLQGSKTKKRK